MMTGARHPACTADGSAGTLLRCTAAGRDVRSPTYLLILSGAEIGEPVIAEGNFLLNEPSQIEAAIAR